MEEMLKQLIADTQAQTILMQREFLALNNRLDGIGAELRLITTRLDTLESRMDVLEARMAVVEALMGVNKRKH